MRGSATESPSALNRRGKNRRKIPEPRPSIVISSETRNLLSAATAANQALLEQIAGDDHALDFTGTFVNRDDAGVAVPAFDVGFARVA